MMMLFKWDSLRKTKRNIDVFLFWCDNQHMSQQAIGKRFNIARTNVSRIINHFKRIYEYREKHPDTCQRDIANHFNLSVEDFNKIIAKYSACKDGDD
jgi:predicted transcriptional regulator